jgi:hypothetical protein
VKGRRLNPLTNAAFFQMECKDNNLLLNTQIF